MIVPTRLLLIGISIVVVSPSGVAQIVPDVPPSRTNGTGRPLVECVESIRNVFNPGSCIRASSRPIFGHLFPLSDAFNIVGSSSRGQVRISAPDPSVPFTTPLVVGGTAAAECFHAFSSGSANELGLRFGPIPGPDNGIRSFAGEMCIVVDDEEQVFVSDRGVGIGGPSIFNLDVFDEGSATLRVVADTDNLNELDHASIVMSQDGGTVQARLGFSNGSNDFRVANSFEFSDLIFSVQEPSSRSFEFVNSLGSIAQDTEARLTGFGDWLIDGSVSSPAADVAEYFPTAPGLEPGDVVSFSGNGLELTMATSANAARLAGVISSHPGVVLGMSPTDQEEGKVAPAELPDEERLIGMGELRVDRHVLHELAVNERGPLALVGRVPIKVTDEGGPIAIGDRLTLATRPGYARRARPGDATFATALDEWLGGEGKIVGLMGASQIPAGQPTRVAAGRAETSGAGRAWIELPADLSLALDGAFDGADLDIQLTSIGSFETLALGRIEARGFEVLSPSGFAAFRWRAERVD